MLARLGGVASASELRRHASWATIKIAVRHGRIVRIRHGKYALPSAKAAQRAARALTGVLCLESAAQQHGWKLKHSPQLPAVAVPRKRNVPTDRREGVRLCRHVTKVELLLAAEAMPDRYRARCLRVAWHADGRAANPFESVLRAIALKVPGLYVVPQEWTDDVGHPDLVDKRLRLVIEAESFEFHGKRRALYKDCERYNAFAMKGWWVVRFSWEHVMFEPDYVREVLTRMVGLLSPQPTVVPRAPRKSA